LAFSVADSDICPRQDLPDIEILGNTGTLPVVPYKTHKLHGNFANHWEAHLEPDWLLIWKIDENKIVITFLF